jgi:transposase
MSQEVEGRKSGTMSSQVEQPGEHGMVSKERWETIRRLLVEERVSVSEIARRMDLDRKTVRRWVRQEQWKSYARATRTDTLLADHEQFVRERAPQVNYSARIVFQELKHQHGFAGSYETVKRAVAPLRELATAGEVCLTRFETEPGQQSQIDWGQCTAWFKQQPITLHVFVLTLGYSRRGYYQAFANEQLSQFLEAHERAFEHFGGLTREHLYDRPRTVCRPDEAGKRTWNPTFKAFAEYWGFEPRVCRAYRAQTKGKVESGVKYVKRNFLPGRRFVDMVDFQHQLQEWNATIADQRVHGTVHERPIVRFERERAHLLGCAGQPAFGLAARVARVVPGDWLVSFHTNRYSVPFRLVGQTVEVGRHGDEVQLFHRGALIATHPLLSGKHQMHIVPEHAPGAIARNQRQRRSHAPQDGAAQRQAEVEVRDLLVYEHIAQDVAIEERAQ